MMPGMDGIETTMQIRKWENENNKETKLPIIALTANAVSGVREMFLSSGFDGFLSKPISAQELDEIIKKWLSPEMITERINPRVAAAELKSNRFLEAVRKTGDINPDTGLEQLSGDIEGYNSTLDMFNRKVIPECDNMSFLLDGKNLYSFMISVHAMKSMLAIIGAQILSNDALELETAAGNNDLNFCMNKYPQFKEKLLSLHKKLSAVFTTDEKKEI